MSPSPSGRLARLLRQDTSFMRLIISAGLVLMGGSMIGGLGAGKPGYTLMEQAMSLRWWGVVCALVGCLGIYGAVCRIAYWPRIALTLTGMYVWSFLTLAQFFDQPLPTRMLLILPATIEVWVLIKVVVIGPRKDFE